jgi:hypothetical protein
VAEKQARKLLLLSTARLGITMVNAFGNSSSSTWEVLGKLGKGIMWQSCSMWQKRCRGAFHVATTTNGLLAIFTLMEAWEIWGKWPDSTTSTSITSDQLGGSVSGKRLNILDITTPIPGLLLVDRLTSPTSWFAVVGFYVLLQTGSLLSSIHPMLSSFSEFAKSCDSGSGQEGMGWLTV